MTTEAPAQPKGFFPKKGWRKVDGVWVAPASEHAKRPIESAADRRNQANRLAGWPVKG